MGRKLQLFNFSSSSSTLYYIYAYSDTSFYWLPWKFHLLITFSIINLCTKCGAVLCSTSPTHRYTYRQKQDWTETICIWLNIDLSRTTWKGYVSIMLLWLHFLFSSFSFLHIIYNLLLAKNHMTLLQHYHHRGLAAHRIGCLPNTFVKFTFWNLCYHQVPHQVRVYICNKTGNPTCLMFLQAAQAAFCHMFFHQKFGYSTLSNFWIWDYNNPRQFR